MITALRLAAVFVAVPAVLLSQSPRNVTVEAYAEFRRGDVVVIDGQRVRAAAATQYSGRDIRSLASVPLGYEVKVEGTRTADGVILASQIEAKPNGVALFESEVRHATDQIEAEWLRAGVMYEPTADGGRKVVGETIREGREFNRVQSVVHRLLPPYIDRGRVRVHLVDTKEWNAAAMGNGAIWVFTGLAREMSDDELAIVVGHEVAHFSHEHSRRQAKRGLWTQLAGLGALVAAESIENDAARVSTQLGTLLGVTAFTNGYSRDLEDQADRVGLRYAHEAGYDVHQGPILWEKFRKKYGETNRVASFFFSSHSRPTDRIASIRRELALNYAR